jgi:hypothetical protein
MLSGAVSPRRKGRKPVSYHRAGTACCRRVCFALVLALLPIAHLLPAAAQSASPPVYNPANGHWYQAVQSATPLTWLQARAAAEALFYAGYRGHLLTLTSADEERFLVSSLPLSAQLRWWMGAYQDRTAPDYWEPAGGWRWVTGEPWVYTDWHSGEPNNNGTGEDAGEFDTYLGYQWNDYPTQVTLSAYLVEYEPSSFGGVLFVQIVPQAVVGGTTATGQVILAAPAGPGGALLTLSSSNPSAAIAPATVAVPPGGTGATFPIVTFPVAVPVTVAISASGFGVAGTAALQVLPAAPPPPPPGGTASAPVYDPGNGHWYQAVRVPGGLTWYAAQAAATALSYAGYTGHLATITSAEENQFIIISLAPASYDGLWLGGYQDTTAPDYFEPAGGWRWITGEPWGFTNWSPGEPNNNTVRGPENHLQINFSNTTWNDLPATYPISGYLVEYEPGPLSAAASIQLLPQVVVGGTAATGVVTLAAPAGPGGALLSLFSSNPAAAVPPATLLVPAGTTTAAFPVVTFPVAVPVTVVISASGFGVAGTATLQVLPAGPVFPPGNLLVNGSFEEPRVPAGSDIRELRGVDELPGWRITRGNVDVVPLPYWQSAPGEGSQSLDLVGVAAGTIEQTFSTVPGQEYLFSGWIAHNADDTSAPEGRANVFLNNTFFVQLFHRDPLSTRTDMRWIRFSYRFQAIAYATTLALVDVTNTWYGGGIFLDGLTIVPAGTSFPSFPAGVPASLTVRLISPTQIDLSWLDTSADETGFEIQRRTGASDWVWVARVAPNTTRFSDFGVSPGTTYTYRVRAQNAVGFSAWSNEASGTTLRP